MILRRRLPVFWALVLSGWLVACAAQTEGRDETDAEASRASQTLVLEPSPAEPLAECGADAGCRLSAYLHPVASEKDCYCPGCPAPLSAAEAAGLEHAWRVHCTDWASRRECRVPMCAPPPGEVGCMEGRCGWRVEEGARTP